MSAASSVLKPPPMPSAGPQRADGYSLGGSTAGTNSGGATGGAYGGAYSQANVDGSNWTVNTGTGAANGGGTSGGNGGVSPQQSIPGPASLFGYSSPVAAVSNNHGFMMVVGFGLIALLLMHKL